MKKLGILIISIGLLFIAFLLVYLTPKNYEKEYVVGNVNLKEKYDKAKRSYTFSVSISDYDFVFVSNMNYTTKSNLIKKLDHKSNSNGLCVQVYLYNEDEFILCNENGEYIDYRLASNDLWDKEEIKIDLQNKKYNNININYLDNNTYLIWNYKGFSLINNNRQENKEIFENDVYNLDLAVIIKDYLVIADYNEKYNFNKMYIINLKKMTVDEWELDSDISFDSYILGTENNSIYLVDRKNRIEYELVPHKKKMRKVGDSNKNGKILVNGQWESVSVAKLVNETHTFTHLHDYEFTVSENKLYLNYEGSNIKTRISNQEITTIVTVLYDKVYYLVKDELFMYSTVTGEVKIFDYFEWNFNNRNMIFVYKS